MKALIQLKLILLATLLVWVSGPSLRAHPDPALDEPMATGAEAGSSLAVPEPSSAVLIAALGIMLMLRRRRLHA